MHSIAFQSSIADTRAKHLSHSACCCCRVAAVVVVAAYGEAINCASQHVISVVVVVVVAVACQKYVKEAPSGGDEELNLGFSCSCSCSCAFGIAIVSSRLHRANRVQ